MFYGEGGSGKTAMLSTAACKGVEEWLAPAKPLLIVRYLGKLQTETRDVPVFIINDTPDNIKDVIIMIINDYSLHET